MTRRAWITGYYGQHNVGDEALLAAVLQHIPHTIAPTILTQRNVALLQSLHSTRVLLEPPFNVDTGRYGLFYGAGYWLRKGCRIVMDLPYRKACVIAGGGCIHPKTAGKVVHFEKRIIALKNWRCRVALLGIGVDYLVSPEDRDAGRRVVNDHVTYCSVRDSTSAEALKDIGADPKHYHQAADLAFALRLPRLIQRRSLARRLSDSTVALNLRPLFEDDQERSAEHERGCRRLAKSIRRLVGQLVLLPFNPADAELLREIGTCCGIKVARLEDDPRRMSTSLQHFDAIIGMRYHAILLAVRLGIPCVPIPCASKLLALGSEIGVPCDDLVVGDGVMVKSQPLLPDAVVDRLEWVWAQRDAFLPNWQGLCEHKAQVAREDMQRCWKSLSA